MRMCENPRKLGHHLGSVSTIVCKHDCNRFRRFPCLFCSRTEPQLEHQLPVYDEPPVLHDHAPGRQDCRDLRHSGQWLHVAHEDDDFFLEFQMRSMTSSPATTRPVAGVLDEPYSAKLAQRSSIPDQPTRLRFQPMWTGGPVRQLRWAGLADCKVRLKSRHWKWWFDASTIEGRLSMPSCPGTRTCPF